MKTLIRSLVWTALFAWPTVETYRWYAAEKDLSARLQVEAKVMHRLAMAKQKVHMAQTVPEPH